MNKTVLLNNRQSNTPTARLACIRMRCCRRVLNVVLAVFINGVLWGQIPAGYYDGAEGKSGDELKTALHHIIDDHTQLHYDDLRDTVLKETDQDPNNADNIILFYTGRSQPKHTFGSGINKDHWNREHVWARSHGNFDYHSTESTDAHHVRPVDSSVNSSRGKKDFDNGGDPHIEAPDTYEDTDSWEPRDAVKGDVARMMFYMAVRYEGDDGELDLELVDRCNSAPNKEPFHGKLSTLLEWHKSDSVDAFERNRNEVVYKYQKNRNPFIDHPEYANLIWQAR